MCEAAGYMQMTTAIAIAVGTLLLGWLIGTRARYALLAAMALKELMKKKAEMGAGEDDDDKVEEDDKDLDEEKSPLEIAMSRENEPGLDDHPDTELNPILLYQIRMAKEELRRKKQAEIAAALEAGEESGAAVVKEGKLRLLTDAGALRWVGKKRLQAGGDARMAEIREQLKKVDTHLATLFEIDVSRVPRPRVTNKIAGGKKVLTALSKANDLKWNPHEFEQVRKEQEVAEYARRGRSRVQPPLDHMLAAQSMARRPSQSGAGRRASVAQATLGRRASVTSGFVVPAKRPDNSEETPLQTPTGKAMSPDVAAKLKGASSLLGQ